MPRPGPRRPYVALRLAQDGLDWIDSEAERRQITRSEQMRLMLRFAQRRMPPDWRPREPRRLGKEQP